MHLLVTRPEPDASRLAQTLAGLGHRVFVEPLLEITATGADPPDLDGVAALIFTSSNGVRAFRQRAAGIDLPVFAVGPSTAAAARKAGFGQVETAGGDAASLARLITERATPGQGALLHVAGRHVAGDLKAPLEVAGFPYRRAVLYVAKAKGAFSDNLVRLAHGEGDLPALDGVLLYSPRTAQLFAALAARAGIATECSRLTAYCLSGAVAEALDGLVFKRLAVAERPDEPALLALLD